MQAHEIRAAGELAKDAFAGTVGVVEQMHKTIADRSFEAVGSGGLIPRVIHSAIAGGVYMGVRRIGGAVPRLGADALASVTPPQASPLGNRPAGSVALGVLNGALGDALAHKRSDLALSMCIRKEGREISVEPRALAEAFEHTTNKVVVFIHGLCETDEAWTLGADGGDIRPGYGIQLEQQLGYTCVYVRYNTGLHVSENGELLARLLERLVDAWPERVAQIALVGHSMGGLVARSASHYASAAGQSWVDSLRHVVCLGSPHMGAPLEKSANVAGWTLDRFAETRAFARLINGRSAGIKDMRYGSCIAEDWHDHDPDELLTDRCHQIPFVEGAKYYSVAATVTTGRDDPAGVLVGDLLVRVGSASGEGRSRRVGFEVENGRHLGGLTHFSLLNHPAVYEQLRAWLEEPRT